jgi:hypothetical protein
MDRNGPVFFCPRRSVLTAFLAACFLADAALFASAQTGAAMTDKTFAAAGCVALWTKSDSVTRFDRFKITRLAVTGTQEWPIP